LSKSALALANRTSTGIDSISFVDEHDINNKEMVIPIITMSVFFTLIPILS
jgi:hypothetical protein